MAKFYIDQDIRQSKIYIAPFKIEKGKAFLIECTNMGNAEVLLKKLNYLGLQPPPKNKKDFEKVDVYEEGDRKVAIYRLVL